MQAELLEDLRGIMRGEPRAVTGEHVTDAPVVTLETPRVTPVTPVTPNLDEGGNANSEGEAVPDRTRPDDDKTPIDERAGLAADRVPPVYLDAWARLNCQKPARVSEFQWRLALDDGGCFLDAFGSEAAQSGWTPGELFDPGDGLVWRLAGEHVRAIGADRAWLSDRSIVLRLQTKGFR